MKKNKQTAWIAVGLILGIITGYVCNQLAPSPAAAKEIASYFVMLTDIFLRLIKMIIAPLVFATLVAGLSGMGDAKTVGRVGGKALGWFVCASFTSLVIGLFFANLFHPGSSMHMAVPDAGTSTDLKTSALNLKDFVTHVFPKNIFEAMAGNEILQILVFALFFGLALGSLRNGPAKNLAAVIEDVVPVMLRVTDAVMKFAPVGVFAAVANVITVQGLGVLMVYGEFVGSFALAIGVLWACLVLAGYLVMGRSIFDLIRGIRQPMILGFSTASSESAYPQLMEELERFGISKRITGFILPLGYSFNLDGSMMYTTFASLFVAQVYGIHLALSEQIAMLLVLMVSSKGIAGVPRASLVVVAAVLPMFHIPEAGLLLIMGIDHFLDMCRTATNVLGNAIATGVVAKWEGAIGVEEEDEDAVSVAAEAKVLAAE